MIEIGGEMAASGKINHDARDVKRKLDVISRKCQELGQLGIAYSSFKTNGLLCLGTKGSSRLLRLTKKTSYLAVIRWKKM